MKSSTDLWPWSFGSSDVDWCESNYKITHLVAEFWNTVSNVLFFIMPPLLIYLFRQYSQLISWRVNIIWVLLIIVGTGSVYFHATLSLIGQLLDEISIIWVVLASFALWCPKRYMPAFFEQDRKSFQQGMLLLAVVTTGLACVWPAINYLALFILGVPATWMLAAEIKRTACRRFFHLGMRCFVLWVCALSSWASDRLLCGMWEALGFPYLHCFWHIFIFLASYTACVCFAYLDACVEVPEMNPTLTYWPNDSWKVLGVPYIALNGMSQELRKYQSNGQSNGYNHKSF